MTFSSDIYLIMSFADVGWIEMLDECQGLLECHGADLVEVEVNFWGYDLRWVRNVKRWWILVENI